MTVVSPHLHTITFSSSSQRAWALAAMASLSTGAGPPVVNVYHEKSMILPDVSRVLTCLYEKNVKFETIKASYKDILSLQVLYISQCSLQQQNSRRSLLGSKQLDLISTFISCSFVSRHQGVFRFHSMMDLYFFKVMSLACVIIEPSQLHNSLRSQLHWQNMLQAKHANIRIWYVVQVNNLKRWITYQKEQQYEKPGEQHFHVKAICIFSEKTQSKPQVNWSCH